MGDTSCNRSLLWGLFQGFGAWLEQELPPLPAVPPPASHLMSSVPHFLIWKMEWCTPNLSTCGAHFFHTQHCLQQWNPSSLAETTLLYRGTGAKFFVQSGSVSWETRDLSSDPGFIFNQPSVKSLYMFEPQFPHLSKWYLCYRVVGCFTLRK